MKIRFKDCIINTEKVVFAKLDETYDYYLKKHQYTIYIKIDEIENGVLLHFDSKEEAEELFDKLMEE